MLVFAVLLATSSIPAGVVDVPCKKQHDGYRCGDVEVHVEAHYAQPADDGHAAFKQRHSDASTRTEHIKGVDVVIDAGQEGRGAWKMFANRVRDDAVTVDVTCDARADDADGAWKKCGKAISSILFASSRWPSKLIDRVEALWDLDHKGSVKCRGNDRSGSCEAIALKWSAGNESGDEKCVAIGWSTTCKTSDKGIVARTPSGIVITCSDASKCGWLFSKSSASSASAPVASSASTPAPSSTTPAAAAAAATTNEASASSAATDAASADAGATMSEDKASSLIAWDKAYEADPTKNAHGYANAAWRAAEEARTTDRGLALGLARVVEHVDPTRTTQALRLDDEIAERHVTRSIAELVGGTVVAIAGAAGGMALFSNKDPTVEGVGAVLGLVVTPPAVAIAIIGGVGTYDETTKEVAPHLPKGLEHRAAWISAPIKPSSPANATTTATTATTSTTTATGTQTASNTGTGSSP